MKRFRFTVFTVLSLCLLAALLPAQTVEPNEKLANDRMPPAQVMDSIGVKAGMTIGEIGAGRGRYTIHLASRVGPAGKVYANDINSASLIYLRSRCEKDGLTNVETILGQVDDPLLPKAALDMAVMVWVFHHLDEPVVLLKNLKPSLKPGATVVILDPDPERNGEKDSDRPSSAASVRKEAEAAGYELIKVETFLPRDTIFILRVKSGA
jgi:ubiquinone/menaquinone biosynthesis C-methylase UbiE